MPGNNWVENQIRPIAIGRNNWLFAGSLRAGKRAAAIMSLVHSARLNGHDPYAYLRDVLERLPTQPARRICGRSAAASLATIPLAYNEWSDEEHFERPDHRRRRHYAWSGFRHA